MFKALLRALFGPARQPAKPSEPAEWRPVRPRIPPRQPVAERKPIGVPAPRTLKGKCYVIDGDTIVISGTRIRIAGIDAPELDHPWGKKSKFVLVDMCKGKTVTAVISDEQSYDRIVAKCYLPDGTDIAAELVRRGMAIDWARFSGGAYRHLEPAGVRRKLWRAAARQKERLKGSSSQEPDHEKASADPAPQGGSDDGRVAGR